MKDITNLFEEIFDLAQILQDKILDLGKLISDLQKNTSD